MAYCEYRVKGLDELKGLGFFVYQKKKGMCQVKIDRGSPNLFCELPDHDSLNCPMGLLAQGLITLEEANEKLREIFKQRKGTSYKNFTSV